MTQPHYQNARLSSQGIVVDGCDAVRIQLDGYQRRGLVHEHVVQFGYNIALENNSWVNWQSDRGGFGNVGTMCRDIRGLLFSRIVDVKLETFSIMKSGMEFVAGNEFCLVYSVNSGVFFWWINLRRSDFFEQFIWDIRKLSKDYSCIHISRMKQIMVSVFFFDEVVIK